MTQTHKQNVPKLRFPGFEGAWKEKQLKDVSTKITDGTHDTPKPVEAGFPYLTAIHVGDGRIDFDKCYFLSPENHQKIQARCAPKFGDLLMVNIGAGTGNCAMVTVDYEFSLKNVAVIQPDHTEISPGFLAHNKRKESKRLRHELTSGGAQPFFSLKQIGKLKIIHPTLPEQRKIAGFLGAVDEKIAQLSRKRALLEDYKKGCMQQLFSQQIRFKDDDGNYFPDWEEKRLGELVSIKKGQQLNRDDMIDGAAFPVINGGITASGYTDTFNTKGNVITISEGGNSCGYVDWQENNFWLGGHCYALPVKGKTALDAFLLQFLRAFQVRIMALRVGSGLPNIQKRDLEKLDVTLPHPDEQRKIANFLSAIDRKIDLVAQELTHARNFKAGLLQQMFV